VRAVARDAPPFWPRWRQGSATSSGRWNIVAQIDRWAPGGDPSDDTRSGDWDNPRHKLRFDITWDLLDRAGIVHRTLAFPGQSMLSEVLQLAYFTDYVSFYLALLNGADPSEVRSIDYLKDQLAKG